MKYITIPEEDYQELIRQRDSLTAKAIVYEGWGKTYNIYDSNEIVDDMGKELKQMRESLSNIIHDSIKLRERTLIERIFNL